MRILVLSNLYPPHGYGGYERCCRDVVERFAERGHDLRVLTSDHRVAGEDEVGPVGVDRVLPLAWDMAAPPAVWRRPAVRRRAVRALGAAVREHRPEVVSVWNVAGLPSPLLRGFGEVALVWVVADAWPERAAIGDPWLAPAARHPRLAGLLAQPTALPDLGTTGTLCFCSTHLRDRTLAATGWSSATSIVAPWGVDGRDFPVVQPPPPERPWSWRLLYVGRLDPGKGIDTVVRAVAQLPSPARLEIVGPLERTHVDRLSVLIANLGLVDRVALTSIPRRALAAVYGQADVCVFPSEWEEPFGIVPLEAMACATPVVATGTGGSGEYLRDGDNCRLFRPGDEVSLARALSELAADDALRARLVAGGRRTAETLTVDRLADQLEELHAGARAGGCGT